MPSGTRRRLFIASQASSVDVGWVEIVGSMRDIVRGAREGQSLQRLRFMCLGDAMVYVGKQCAQFSQQVSIFAAHGRYTGSHLMLIGVANVDLRSLGVL